MKYKIIGNTGQKYYLKQSKLSGVVCLSEKEFFNRVDIIKQMYPEESCYIGYISCINMASDFKSEYDFCAFIESCDAKYKLVGYGPRGKLIILNSFTGEQINYCPTVLFKNPEVIKNISPIRGFYIGMLAATKIKQRKSLVKNERKYSNNIRLFKKRRSANC